MSTILSPLPSNVPRHHGEIAPDASCQPRVELEVCPGRSLAKRIRRPRGRRVIVCLLASLAVHGVAMAALAYVRQTTSWNWIPVQSGRASIELQASIAATPSKGEPEFEVVPIPIPTDSEKRPDEEEPTELVEATATDVERDPGAVEPPPIRSVDQEAEPLVLAEVEVSVESDLIELLARRDSNREEVAEASDHSHTMRRANVGLRYANELTDQLAESLPSMASQASQGAESQSPELVFNPAPRYPAEALAARLTGRVVVRVVLAVDGSVAEASVHRSSGSNLLDDAAVAAVLAWRFASSENGAISRRLAVPINFVIQEGV